MEHLLLWVRGKFTDGAKNLIHIGSLVSSI